MLVQLTIPLPHCPWVLSGHRPFYLFIMQFLVLVLASGDEKDEGKEPEMEEFVDTKGISHPIPRLCTLERVLGSRYWERRKETRWLLLWEARVIACCGVSACWVISTVSLIGM